MRGESLAKRKESTSPGPEVFEAKKTGERGREKTAEKGPEREAGRREREQKAEAEAAAEIENIREQLAEIGKPKEASKETPAAARSEEHVERAAALERALGIPIDKDKAMHAMENTRTFINPINYAREAYKYALKSVPDTAWGKTKAAWKGLKMALTTAGLRDSSRDAIFINFMNGGFKKATKLHETLHALSEGKNMPEGKDFLGGKRAVSGIEQVSADGTIQLTPLNEGLTNFFTARAGQELKGDREPAKYSADVKIVSRLASLLDGQGQEGAKFLAEAYLNRDADSLRDAVDRLGGQGSFESLTQAMGKEGLLVKMLGIGGAARTMSAIERRARAASGRTEKKAG